jgi:hypothetical protein
MSYFITVARRHGGSRYPRKYPNLTYNRGTSPGVCSYITGLPRFRSFAHGRANQQPTESVELPTRRSVVRSCEATHA